MTIVQAPGSTYINGRRTAVEVKVNDFRGIATADNTLDFYVSDVKRLTPEAAEAVSYNILNASTSLYDRLDNDKPVVNSISVTKKGELKVLATDTKTQKYTSSLTYCYEPISEPANSGIVGYQITKSTTEPYTNWIEVSKTNSLDITTSAVEDNGTYYVWVLDVGGNTNYKEVVVSGLSFDTTPPTLGTAKTKAYEDSIEIEITGATDENGISKYEFLLDGKVVATQKENKYVYKNLEDGKEYTLSYKVIDNSDNSVTSKNIVVSTIPIKVSEVYTINNKYITRINPNITLEDFLKNINSKVQGAVLTRKGENIEKTSLIGTGMQLKTTKGDFIIIITADVNGDGKFTATDLLKLKEKLVGLETFDEIADMAADINFDNGVSSTDLFKAKQVFVGLVDF